MVLNEITFMPIFGLPLIVYLGTITFLSFIATAAVGLMIYKGIRKIPIKWHFRLAMLSICLAIIHGTLGFLAYL